MLGIPVKNREGERRKGKKELSRFRFWHISGSCHLVSGGIEGTRHSSRIACSASNSQLTVLDAHQVFTSDVIDASKMETVPFPPPRVALGKNPVRWRMPSHKRWPETRDARSSGLPHIA